MLDAARVGWPLALRWGEVRIRAHRAGRRDAYEW